MTVWACVASGPSLVPEDVELLRGRVRTLVINDNYRLAPWADAIYAADMNWWHVHHERVAPHFAGRMYSIENAHDPQNPRIGEQLYGLKVFREEPDRNLKHIGLSRVPGVLRLGGLSGYQAINAAYLWGASVILLLGYDCKLTNGLRHWFGDHPAGLNQTNSYDKRVKHFATIRPADYGIEIINCSRETALDCFPRADLAETLARLLPEAA